MLLSIALIFALVMLFKASSLRYSSIRRNFAFQSSSSSLSSSLQDVIDKSLKIRPSIDDIEKISYGQAAKRRGTGSRAVPHRLNNLERKEWDLAKRRRYLLLRGTGWRKERGDSPLANIYRNYCDAVAIPCISIRRGVQSGSLLYDELIIDLSPLRTINNQQLVDRSKVIIQSATSLIDIEDRSDISSLGWTNMEQMLAEEVIWRLPSYTLSARFTNRKECKQAAEKIANEFANGELVVSDEYASDDVEEEQDG
jgi:hypothetical protein